MRPRLLPTLLVRLLTLLQVFQQEGPRSLLATAGYGPQQCCEGVVPRSRDDVDDETVRTTLPPPPIDARRPEAAEDADADASGPESRVATRAGVSSFRAPAAPFLATPRAHADFGRAASAQQAQPPPTACWRPPGRGAAPAAAESLRLVLATSRGGGGSGGGFSHRTRHAPGRGGTRPHVNDDPEGFGWDDAKQVFRSVSTRGRNAWQHRVRPFLQHRVLPALKDPGGWFGTDAESSSRPSKPEPVAAQRFGESRRFVVQLGQVQHLTLLAVAGCVVGDVLPLPSSAVDFDFVLKIASTRRRTSSRFSHDPDDEAACAGFVEWWNSVLRQPKNLWNPLSKAAPTVQRIVGSLMGLLASQLVQPIVPALVRLAIVAMVAGEANSFLCDQYGEGWYETHANDHVDHWLRHLDDALERWRRAVRSALQDPGTSYRRLRRTVDAQLQQEMAIPTHVANGMIGGVVVGLAVA